MKVNEIPLPTGSTSLPKDSTLIKVAYATLNPVDYKIAESYLAGRFITRTPGSDFAGQVVSSTHSDLKAGDPVFGIIDVPTFGALAEYAIVKGRQNVVNLPDSVDPKDAAALGVVALTAYQAIVPFVTEGDHIFINGGSGGVGTFAIQIAKIIGCHVTVSCSTGNVELCKSLGADDVIDYRTNDVVEALKQKGTQFTLMLDAVGTPVIYYSAHHYLKPNGTFNTIAMDPTSFASLRGLVGMFLLPKILGGGQRPIKWIGAQADTKVFTQLAQWLKEGKIKTYIDQEYELDQAKEAFAKLKTGRTRGKIVIKVAKD